MKRNIFVAAAISLVLSGCASQPTPRAEYSGLPPLERGWSRVYFSAGTDWLTGRKLQYKEQVGPVFINDQLVGSNAIDEHFVVDVRPGTYQVYCAPEHSHWVFPEKQLFTFAAGETRYLVCDMGYIFNLRCTIAGIPCMKTYLNDKPLDSNSKLVAYRKFP